MSQTYKKGDYLNVKYPVLLDITRHDDGSYSGDYLYLPAEKQDRFDDFVTLIPEGFAEVISSAAHYSALATLPRAEGTRWQVSRDIYTEFLGCLPPIPYKSGFMISEAIRDAHDADGKLIGVLRSAYYSQPDETYWHEYVVDTRK